MKGVYLRLYMHETSKHGHILLYEWILEQAKKIGIKGASVFRSIAGFGSHGTIQEQHFFELAGNLTLEVEFLITHEEANKLIAVVREQRIRLVVARIDAEIEVLEGGA